MIEANYNLKFMKKFLTVILGLIFTVAVSGCEKSAEEEKIQVLEEKISNLENQIAEDEGAPEKTEEETVEEKPEVVEPKEEEKEEEEIKKEVYEGPNFIQIKSPANNAGISKQPVVFTGEVSPNTTKIIVSASSEGPDGPVEYNTYQLQNFKEGDKTFKYNAKIDFENLKSGENHYEFKAFFDDETTKVDSVSINFYVGENSISLSQPSSGNGFMVQPIELKGTVSPNVNKIVVKAWRSAGDYTRFSYGPYAYEGYQDVYTLQNFKPGDSTFTYKAAENFSNLSVGPNNYEFTAYFDDGSTKTVGVYDIWFGIDQN